MDCWVQSINATVALRCKLSLDSGRITGNPHLIACFSDWSRHAAADTGIWQSRPLQIKWQDWIAPAGGLIVLRERRQWQHNVALSGGIPLQPAQLLEAGLTDPLSLPLNAPLRKFGRTIKPDQNLTNVLRHHEIY